MSDNWLEDLEKQTKEVFNNKNTVVATQNKNNNVFLVGIVVLLSVVVFFTWMRKTSHAQFNQPKIGNNWSNPQILPPMTINGKIEQLQKQYETIDLAANKIWERTKWNSDRITMLATVNNHNLVVLQGNHPKSELILLNPNWTINRMPDRIKLDEEDQEFMKKFIEK